MKLEPLRTAVIGCGTISSVYLQNAMSWKILDIVACADLDRERAEGQAARFHISRAATVSEVLADPSIELIINLTVPAAHFEVGLAALRAGKSVYSEKPLAISREGGRLLLHEARVRGLRVGCAPDTFMGGGLQTCRRLIDEGAIGQPVAVAASKLSRGPEHWHPDPEFFYKAGGGPLFDMGPYYLTALVTMLGPVRRATGSVRTTFPERTISREPRRGSKITVETSTHIASLLDFASGPIATLVNSFDIGAKQQPTIEIHGTKGSLRVPDPNKFAGPVRLQLDDDEDGREVHPKHGYTDNSRGIGVADMAYAIREGRPHRASGDMAFHVLDVMLAILEAADTGRSIEVASTCERPAALPEAWPEPE